MTIKHLLIAVAGLTYILGGCSSKNNEFACEVPKFKQEKKQKVTYDNMKVGKDCEVVEMVRYESTKARQKEI